MNNPYWLNTDSRQFLQRGYLLEGETAEKRIEDIAKKAEEYLELDGFATKFIDYMDRGFFHYPLLYGLTLGDIEDCLFHALGHIFQTTWKKFYLKYLK